MTQLFNSLTSECSEPILCCYINGTTEILIAKIKNIPNGGFERVIFPKERFLFEALPTAQLEIHRNTPNKTTFIDVISCSYLRVGEGNGNSKAMALSTVKNSKIIPTEKIA